jgi:tripartite-type tricarboxylate transporter receptor subunit TctC
VKFTWVGSTNSEVSMAISWGTSPVKTLKDVMRQELIIGSSGVGNDTGAFPRVLNHFLGTKFKPIHGYQSGTDILLAIERKEVMGRVGWSWSSVKSRKPKWIKKKKINLLVQMGLKKAKDNPDTPLALDFAKTPEDRQAMELIFSATTIGWPSLLPPGVPKDRAQAIRAAYRATMKDKAFLKGAKKRRLGVDPVTGEEIEAIIAKIYSFPPAIVKRAQEAYKPKGRLLKVKLMTAKGTISKINKKGSKFTLKSGAKKVKARVSRRSKVKIAGKKVKRKKLKKGMECEITLAASGAVAQKVNCN